MAGKEKPYKVYRGGRVKGPVRPLRDRPEPRKATDGRDAKPKLPRAGRPRRWRRGIVLTLVLLVVLSLVWALLGYLAIRRGVKASNERSIGPMTNASPGFGSTFSASACA